MGGYAGAGNVPTQTHVGRLERVGSIWRGATVKCLILTEPRLTAKRPHEHCLGVDFASVDSMRAGHGPVSGHF
jgi:hypothetical protein